VHLSISELAANYKQLAEAILNAGPLVNDNLADLKVICERACAIRERTTKHFGVAAAPVVLTDDELKQLLEQPSVRAANESLGLNGEVGVQGPFVDVLVQLIQLAMQNPQLLQLILALFQMPA
jgi:hypothetical protein